MAKAQSVIAKKNLSKVKTFIKKIIDSRKDDSKANADTGAEDMANMILYAIGVALSDPAFIAAFNAIVNPENAAVIGTPCGVVIENLTKEE